MDTKKSTVFIVTNNKVANRVGLEKHDSYRTHYMEGLHIIHLESHVNSNM